MITAGGKPGFVIQGTFRGNGLSGSLQANVTLALTGAEDVETLPFTLTGRGSGKSGAASGLQATLKASATSVTEGKSVTLTAAANHALGGLALAIADGASGPAVA